MPTLPQERHVSADLDRHCNKLRRLSLRGHPGLREGMSLSAMIGLLKQRDEADGQSEIVVDLLAALEALQRRDARARDAAAIVDGTS